MFIKFFQENWIYLQANLSWSSLVGATSIALLEWQFNLCGSAPSLTNKEHTSTLDLEAASCKGVKAHKSLAFTSAPCFISISVTSKWPYEQALWRGTKPLQNILNLIYRGLHKKCYTLQKNLDMRVVICQH